MARPSVIGEVYQDSIDPEIDQLLSADHVIGMENVEYQRVRVVSLAFGLS